jgi:hypothetical protein
MLGIREIFGSDLDPTPDPIPFFSHIADAKKNILLIFFFLITYPQAHFLQS